MRTFEHFPQDGKTRCPLCGTDADRPCLLLPIDGTDRDGLCECAPTHVDCLQGSADQWRVNMWAGVVYRRVKQ